MNRETAITLLQDMIDSTEQLCTDPAFVESMKMGKIALKDAEKNQQQQDVLNYQLKSLHTISVGLNVELIEREKLLESAKKYQDVLKDIEKTHSRATIDGARKTVIASLVGIIKEAPTVDAVLVVRCGECRFSSEQGGYKTLEEIETCVNCTKWLTANHSVAIMPKDGHCFLGKPKTPPAE